MVKCATEVARLYRVSIDNQNVLFMFTNGAQIQPVTLGELEKENIPVRKLTCVITRMSNDPVHRCNPTLSLDWTKVACCVSNRRYSSETHGSGKVRWSILICKLQFCRCGCGMENFPGPRISKLNKKKNRLQGLDFTLRFQHSPVTVRERSSFARDTTWRNTAEAPRPVGRR